MAFGLLLSQSAVAQQASEQQLEKVEITGSSIKRINAESSLPVTVITKEEIKKTGATSTTELIQALPAMQGFLTSSQSVNGGGGGVTNASIHAVGSRYTLVLLNGRRLAPYNTGTAVNLDSIPLGSIERIEVLTDGASALYGADAIAGVVNFILKKNGSDGTIDLRASRPQRKNGESENFSISKGFGDIATDRFNIQLGLTYDHQKELNASDRSFSKTGLIQFNNGGQNTAALLLSSNSVPGNVILIGPGANYSTDPTDVGLVGFFSPYLQATGTCPAQHVRRSGRCYFDYPSTVETVPESDRLSLFSSGRFEVNSNLTLFSEVALARFANKPRYAPPAQPGIFLSQALYNAHVAPYLTNLGLTPADVFPVGDPNFNGPTMNVRVYDAGGRQDKYQTDSIHIVLGAEGKIGNWDYSGYFTHSQNRQTDETIGGYLSNDAFSALIASGAYDPLAATAGQSTAVLAPAVLKQKIDTQDSSIDVVGAKASGAVFALPAGDLAVGAGFDFTEQKFKDSPAPIYMGNNKLQPTFTDTIIGGGGGVLPFDSKRQSAGVFAEVVAPVTSALEVTGAVRFDSYGKVKNSKNFDAAGNPIGAADQGKDGQSTTAKISARFQPIKSVLIRGSIGTGFKAPTMGNITSPLAAFGNTGMHNCPPGLAAAIASACRSGQYEYNIQAGGNPASDNTGLKPEKSQQLTLGARFEPTEAISAGFDLWSVSIKDQIGTITEDVAFSDGVTYGSLFKIAADPITGAPTLTFLSQPRNLGKAVTQGVDVDIESRINTDIGKLTTKFSGTYFVKADYQVPGLPGYQTSLGKIGPDTQVTFRYILQLESSLKTGAFTNTVRLTYKPSYKDVTYAAGDGVTRLYNPTTNAFGAFVDVTDHVVSRYYLVDWQTKYDYSKSMIWTLGIKNLLNHNPPLTLQDQGGTGNARGFDGRYTDPLGRTFQVAASYKF
jgi:iron complex outermembrane receptor protein